MAPVALLLSPHPDDELLGCPAHLFALRDAGWRIVNLAMTLGSDIAQRERRLGELREACRRAEFDLANETGSADVSDVLDLASALEASLLVAPSPHDDHPAHERVGRIAVSALRSRAAPRLWFWGLWADLGLPNSLCAFDQTRLGEIEFALRAHSGELARNDYSRLLRARASVAAVLGPERVFGHGSDGLPADAFAETICDVTLGETGDVLLSSPARFDPASFPDDRSATGTAIDSWLDSPSPRRSGRAGP
jgi:hypothetical protein